MRTEPAVIVAATTAVAVAVVGLLVAFGVPMTEDQQAAVLGVVGALAPIVAGVVTRHFVYAPATVTDTVARAAAAMSARRELDDGPPDGTLLPDPARDPSQDVPLINRAIRPPYTEDERG